MNFEIIKLNQSVRVDESWLRLHAYVQEHPFCQLNIVFKNGIPVMIEKGIENVKLSL